MSRPAGFTLGELAATLGAKLEGDPGRRVTGVAALDVAGPEQISFLIDTRYRPAAETSRAGALLVAESVSGLPGPLLRSGAPQQALIALLTLFHPASAPPPGIDASAIVARDARVDPSASVGALAVIGAGAVIGPRVRIHPLVYVGAGVEVGEGSLLHPRVVLCEGVRLGCSVVVQAGAVIGGDDRLRLRQRGPQDPQVGIVVIVTWTRANMTTAPCSTHDHPSGPRSTTRPGRPQRRDRRAFDHRGPGRDLRLVPARARCHRRRAGRLCGPSDDR
jgi:UDP-3-O-[3-hydroxymyristoyl] glucosamine N-acyltransferase LpxD